MSKKKKVLTAILISLIAVAAITVAVFYLVQPTQTKAFMNNVWVWVNQPLPVVGFSILFIAFFVWRVFTITSLGQRQINQFKRRTALIEDDFETLKVEYKSKINELTELINYLKSKSDEFESFMETVIKKLPNKKVRELGVKFYAEREKETNNETETK